MPNITTIIFDVGGVLLRTEDRRPRTMLADAFGMTTRQLEDIFFSGEQGDAAQRGDVTAAEHWDTVRDRLGLRADEIDAVRDTFFSGDVLDRELLDYTHGLKGRFRLAIITNAFGDARASLTLRFHLDATFDPIVISAEEGMMKPDPRIYQIALARCGAAPEEAVFVDDFPANTRGAEAVGMRTIWFRSRDQLIRDLDRLLQR